MIRDYAIVRESAAQVAWAAENAIASFEDGRVEQEPALTDRLLASIEAGMREFESKGVRWRAKTLTDRGRNSQEKTYGADFAGVLDIQLSDYSVKKGFLAQAKIMEPGEGVSNSEYTRMREQCERMLSFTSESFLFVYSLSGIIVVPALSIVSAGRINPHELYNRKIASFFELHFEYFIGDQRLSAPNISGLRALQADIRIRRILLLKASE